MRRTWLGAAGAILMITIGWALPKQESRGVQAARAYFKAEAPLFAASCAALDSAIRGIGADSAIQAGHLELARQKLLICRLHYKKIEAFLEYFFTNAAHVYNSPPKFEPEEPYMEFQAPVGLQVIEALLYDTNALSHKAELIQQAETVASSATDLPALLYDLDADDGQVLESLKLEIIRVMTLGITGYDAPLLKSGLAEAQVSLMAIQTQLQPFLIPGDKRSDSLGDALTKAIKYFPKSGDFDSFDRLTFLRDYCIPLQHQLSALTRERGLLIKEAGALNSQADNLFSANALSIDHFAPGPNNTADTGTSTKGDAREGERLFNDQSLSANGTRSCATCHSPDKGFTDRLPNSISIDGHAPLTRNAPTLLYCAYQYSQFWDGRAKSLEEQITTVLNDPREMGGHAQPQIVKALAAYVRSLHPLNSPFDQYMQGNNKALTASQQAGANLFMGKAQCATCHFLPLLNGLIPPDYAATEFEVLGTTASEDFAHPVLSTDKGRYDVYGLPFNKGSFKTPTVRNAALTYPYMHNGAFASLDKVVEFYNKGGGGGLGLDIPEQTLPVTPLGLSIQEQTELIDFLKALTDKNP
jgi:cytochrome c peroxidase